MEDYSDYKGKIGTTTGYLMIGTAMLFDGFGIAAGLISLIPIVGWIIGPILSFFAFIIAWFLFFIWFKWLSLNFFEKALGIGGKWGAKKALRMIAKCFSLVVEGVVSFYPGWTILILITVKGVQEEAELVRKGILTPEDLEAMNDLAENTEDRDIAAIAQNIIEFTLIRRERRIRRRALEQARENTMEQRIAEENQALTAQYVSDIYQNFVNVDKTTV